MIKYLLNVIIVLLAFNSIYAQDNTQSTLKEMVITGIVYIKPNPDDEEIGAGFLVNASGYIFTNYHVIKNADNEMAIHIEFSNGSFCVPERILYKDSINDIAIIKIPTALTKGRAILPLHSLEGIVGEDIISFGHPLGFKFNMTKGVISNMYIENEPQRFLFDAPTNPGNSGGPLLNKFGLVVGMVEGRYDSKSAGIDVQNLNTGIKVSYLKKALEKFNIKYDSKALLEDKELIERQKMLMSQDSLRKTQASQDLAVKESRRKQDSIQSHLEKQKREIDSARVAQEAIVKMLEQERNERKKFQDSLREANKPKPWVAKLSFNYGYDLGALQDLEDNQGLKNGGPFWDIDVMFGYRTNIVKNDDKGTIAALFVSAGMMDKKAASVHYWAQNLIDKIKDNPDKYFSPDKSSLFLEGEAGFVIGEGLRLSAGMGAISIRDKFFNYYTVTGGFNFPLGPVNLDILFSSMMGQDFPFPTLRFKAGLGYRIYFE